jgi:hypothetical protein
VIGRHARRNTAQPELRTADTRLQQVLGPRKRYALDGPYGLAAFACGARSTNALPPKELPRAIRGGPPPPELTAPPPGASPNDRPSDHVAALAASEDTSWAAPGVRRARQPRGVGADR